MGRLLPFVTATVSPLLIPICHCLPSLLLHRTFDSMIIGPHLLLDFIWVDVGLIFVIGPTFAMESDLLVFNFASSFTKLLFWSFKIVSTSHLISILRIQSICPHQAHFILFPCNHAKEL